MRRLCGPASTDVFIFPPTFPSLREPYSDPDEASLSCVGLSPLSLSRGCFRWSDGLPDIRLRSVSLLLFSAFCENPRVLIGSCCGAVEGSCSRSNAVMRSCALRGSSTTLVNISSAAPPSYPTLIIPASPPPPPPTSSRVFIPRWRFHLFPTRLICFIISGCCCSLSDLQEITALRSSCSQRGTKAFRCPTNIEHLSSNLREHRSSY